MFNVRADDQRVDRRKRRDPTRRVVALTDGFRSIARACRSNNGSRISEISEDASDWPISPRSTHPKNVRIARTPSRRRHIDEPRRRTANPPDSISHVPYPPRVTPSSRARPFP